MRTGIREKGNILIGKNCCELFEAEVQAISWEAFTKVEFRVGRIVCAALFPEAKKPAYVLRFGKDIGIKKPSAQITDLYKPEELVGKLIVRS